MHTLAFKFHRSSTHSYTSQYLANKAAASAHAAYVRNNAKEATTAGPSTAPEANEDEDIDIDMDIVEPTAGVETIPSAWDVPKTFRLTRDWPMWPSAGKLQHEVSNSQQAQYGLIADTVFETMKVSIPLLCPFHFHHSLLPAFAH